MPKKMLTTYFCCVLICALTWAGCADENAGINGDGDADGDIEAFELDASEGLEEAADAEDEGESELEGTEMLEDGDGEAEEGAEESAESDLEEADGDGEEATESDLEETDGDAVEADNSTTPYWTDEESGLMWQNPPPENEMNWQEARDYCEALTLGGFVDWEMPGKVDMQASIAGCASTEPGGTCDFSQCTYNGEEPFECSVCSIGCSDKENQGPDGGCYRPVEMEGACEALWVNETLSGYEDHAWRLLPNVARFTGDWKTAANYVRCVREVD